MAAVRLSPQLRFAWWLHRTLLRLSGGRIGTWINGMPVLLLTTRGRRSGTARTIALQYQPSGDAFVVIASNAGEPRHPAWWLNLEDLPEADVAIRGTVTHVRAREALGDEREELLARFAAIDDAYAAYERRTDRRIPVVVLEPRARE